jgi:hypothetical protein
MTTATTTPPRTTRRGRNALPPTANGLPDPRPVTDYTVALSVVAGKSRLTVTLTQPCAIRAPRWAVIDCTNGGRVYPTSATVVSTTQFYLDFASVLSSAVAFVEVPYQDTQVQNAMGGFVAPGGKWFREPVIA